MVHNRFIKCQVCGKITRIRLQVGWLEKHPIVVTCGNCGTSLSGYVTILQDDIGLKYEFDNANSTDEEDKAEYLVECSGEFPVFKQCDAGDVLLITPYIRFGERMKDEKAYDQFCDDVARLIKISKRWTVYKRIRDLYQNKSPYTKQEVQKVFEGEYFQCRDEFELARAVHMIEVHGFYSSLKKDILTNISIGDGVMHLDFPQLKGMLDFLNSHSGYSISELQSLIYKIEDAFIEVFQALIPAYSIKYLKDDSIDYEAEGSTTSTFETVKQFYLDVYEALGNLLIIPVALNNIKYRGNFNCLSGIEKNAHTMADFISMSKATRFHYCIRTELYTDFLGVKVNAKLRNAIGHNDVKYDTVSQLITYIPNPKDRSKKMTEWLLQFEDEAICMFQGVLGISEYLYKLNTIVLMLEGNVPIMPGR